MRRPKHPAEWGKLAHLFDEINESFIDYGEQTDFLWVCRERLAPGARLALDLGCGTGQHAWRLTTAGLRTVGLDLSPALLRHAVRRTGPASPQADKVAAVPHFVCGNLTALPLAGRFDLVFALNFVFSFLHTNEAIAQALSEVRRVLAPRGVFLLDYHVFFPPTAEDRLKPSWQEQCQVRGEPLVITHRPVVDWLTQLSTDRMTYRFLENRRVVRKVESTEVRRVSLPQDLALILGQSGFEIVGHCARFDLDEAPDGRLGVLIAKRKR